MKSWDLTISLDRQSPIPLARQIVEAIEASIRNGQLAAGSPLPSSRRLSETLGVNRSTVVSAFECLLADQWLVATQGGGTYVNPEAPRLQSDLPSGANLVSLSALPEDSITGVPEPQHLPTPELARAYRRALTVFRGEALRPTHAQGHPFSLAAIAQHLTTTRGLRVRPEELLLTRGPLMALLMFTEAWVTPGTPIAVEPIGDPRVWRILRRAGAVLEPVPCDQQGLVVSELRRRHASNPVRGLVISPQCQYATGVKLSPPRRRELLGFLEETGLFLIEWDYGSEFVYESAPSPALCGDLPIEQCCFLGSLTKLLTPGAQLGYLVAARSSIDACVEFRELLDQQGDTALELAIATLLRDGELSGFRLRLFRSLCQKRKLFGDALRAALPECVHVQLPQAGLSFWITAPGFPDLQPWISQAEHQGVSLRPGSYYHMHGETIGAVRIPFAQIPFEDLPYRAARLGKAFADAFPARLST